MDDITALTMKYYFVSPDAIIAALSCAAEMDDVKQFKWIVAECKKRNIDLKKIIKDEMARREKMWGLFDSKTALPFSGGDRIRSPFHIR